MIIHSPLTHGPQSRLLREVLITLLNLAPPSTGNVIPSPGDWPTTRQIANAHDLSIYKARLLLLELTKIGLVIVSERAINNSLRWYPYNVNGEAASATRHSRP